MAEGARAGRLSEEELAFMRMEAERASLPGGIDFDPYWSRDLRALLGHIDALTQALDAMYDGWGGIMRKNAVPLFSLDGTPRPPELTSEELLYWREQFAQHQITPEEREVADQFAVRLRRALVVARRRGSRRSQWVREA